MQLVILVGHVEGNLFISARAWPDNILIATLLLLLMDLVETYSGSELVRKQI